MQTTMPKTVAYYKNIRDKCLSSAQYGALRTASVAKVNRDHPNLPPFERAMKVRIREA